MNDLPRTPEGRLIRRARELAIPKLSIRAAAARIGMSPEQWGYAERGYLPSRGGAGEREFRPPAPTLARMGTALGLTPEQLAAAGRADAADALREMTGTPDPGQDPEKQAVVHAVRTLYPGDDMAELIMTQWDKPLEVRQRELDKWRAAPNAQQALDFLRNNLRNEPDTVPSIW